MDEKRRQLCPAQFLGKNRLRFWRYAAQAGYGLEAQNRCAEIKLRAERRAGELLERLERSVGGRPQKNSSHDGMSFYEQSIMEGSVSRMSAFRWQQAATVPEEDFEAHIARTKDAGRKLTSMSVYTLSKKLDRHPPRHIGPDCSYWCTPGTKGADDDKG